MATKRALRCQRHSPLTWMLRMKIKLSEHYQSNVLSVNLRKYREWSSVFSTSSAPMPENLLRVVDSRALKLRVKLHSLRQVNFTTPIDGIGLAPHVGPP